MDRAEERGNVAMTGRKIGVCYVKNGND